MRILPFMVLNGEQKHITENYVSVPPALTITDDSINDEIDIIFQSTGSSTVPLHNLDPIYGDHTGTISFRAVAVLNEA